MKHLDSGRWAKLTSITLFFGALSACGGSTSSTEATETSVGQVDSAVVKAPVQTKSGTPGCAAAAHLTSTKTNVLIPSVPVLVVPVYWGSNVNDLAKTVTNNAIAALSNSQLLKMAKAEYAAPPVNINAGITITPHVATGSTVVDSDIQAELNWQISNRTLPGGNSNLYIVVFSPTVTPRSMTNGELVNLCAPSSKGGVTCAYHGQLARSGVALAYAVIPDPSSGDCVSPAHWCADSVTNSYDAMTVGESHEIVEALTDTGGGFRNNPGLVVPARATDPCRGIEIGDLCQSQSFETIENVNGSIVGVWLQKEWSNKANACVTGTGALGDFDGDGFSDLAATDIAPNGVVQQNVPLAFSNADGSYHAVTGHMTSGDTQLPFYSTLSPAKALSGDFNGDGYADFALTGGPGWNSIPLALSNGDGTFVGTNAGEQAGQANTFMSFANQPGAKFVTGDFNGDGFTDVAIFGLAGMKTVPIAYSNGDGTWVETNSGVTRGSVWTDHTVSGKVVSGDFDCNGFSDVAILDPSLTFIPTYLSNGDGTFHTTGGTIGNTQFTNWAGRPGATPVAGDFNGDCFADIALTGGSNWTTIPVVFGIDGQTWNTTNLHLSSGDTNFPGHAALPGVKPIAGDFDGDGLSDIALTGGSGWTTAPTAFSNGDGTFRGTNARFTNGSTGFDVATAVPGSQVITW